MKFKKKRKEKVQNKMAGPHISITFMAKELGRQN